MNNTEALHISSKENFASSWLWLEHWIFIAWGLVPASLLVLSLEWKVLSDSVSASRYLLWIGHHIFPPTPCGKVPAAHACCSFLNSPPSPLSASLSVWVRSHRPERGWQHWVRSLDRAGHNHCSEPLTCLGLYIDKSQLCTHGAMGVGTTWSPPQWNAFSQKYKF